MIRVITGLLVCMGAVGTLEQDPQASVLAMVALAAVGLAIMASGTNSLKEA